MITWSVTTKDETRLEQSETITAAWQGAFDTAESLVNAGYRDTITITVQDQSSSIIPEQSDDGAEHDRITTLLAIDDLRQITYAAWHAYSKEPPHI